MVITIGAGPRPRKVASPVLLISMLAGILSWFTQLRRRENTAFQKSLGDCEPGEIMRLHCTTKLGGPLVLILTPHQHMFTWRPCACPIVWNFCNCISFVLLLKINSLSLDPACPFGVFFQLELQKINQPRATRPLTSHIGMAEVMLDDRYMECPTEGCPKRIVKVMVCSGRANPLHKGLPFRTVSNASPLSSGDD